MKSYPKKKGNSIKAYIEYIKDWMDFKDIKKNDIWNVHWSIEITASVIKALNAMEKDGLITMEITAINDTGMPYKKFGKVTGWGKTGAHTEITVTRK